MKIETQEMRGTKRDWNASFPERFQTAWRDLSKIKNPHAVWIALSCLLFLNVTGVNAQQTIFNVPSADVTPEGEVYLEHESQFRPWKPNRFWLGTHYTALGIGHNTELDMTLANVSSPASDNIVLCTGAKSNILLLPRKWPDRELKLTLGTLVNTSLQGEGVGNWSYAHLSGRMPKLKTRLTAGVSTGTKQLFGRNTVGFIGGIEQPVTSRFTIITDWFSGTHANGYLIPGFSYVLIPENSTTIFIGYQIPNTSRVGPSGFVIELSALVPVRGQKKVKQDEPDTPAPSK